MGEDRSLDEFFDADAADDADDADGESDTNDGVDLSAEPTASGSSEPDAGATDDEPPTDADDEPLTDESDVDDEPLTDESDVDDEPLTDESDHTTDLPRATYRWSPDGDDCPVCGTSVEAQWRDGDQFVCADCKEW